MSAPLRKVTFEYVSAIAHPECYSGDRPRVRPDDVPDEHWSRVERQGEGVDSQFAGLQELMASGELIRNVHLYKADTPAEPQWREVPVAATITRLPDDHPMSVRLDNALNQRIARDHPQE